MPSSFLFFPIGCKQLFQQREYSSSNLPSEWLQSARWRTYAPWTDKWQ